MFKEKQCKNVGSINTENLWHVLGRLYCQHSYLHVGVLLTTLHSQPAGHETTVDPSPQNW